MPRSVRGVDRFAARLTRMGLAGPDAERGARHYHEGQTAVNAYLSGVRELYEELGWSASRRMHLTPLASRIFRLARKRHGEAYFHALVECVADRIVEGCSWLEVLSVCDHCHRLLGIEFNLAEARELREAVEKRTQAEVKDQKANAKGQNGGKEMGNEVKGQNGGTEMENEAKSQSPSAKSQNDGAGERDQKAGEMMERKVKSQSPNAKSQNDGAGEQDQKAGEMMEREVKSQSPNAKSQDNGAGEQDQKAGEMKEKLAGCLAGLLAPGVDAAELAGELARVAAGPVRTKRAERSARSGELQVRQVLDEPTKLEQFRKAQAVQALRDALAMQQLVVKQVVAQRLCGRMAFADIAERVGLSVEDVKDIMARMREWVRRHTTYFEHEWYWQDDGSKYFVAPPIARAPK